MRLIWTRSPLIARSSGIPLNDKFVGHHNRGTHNSRTGKARCWDCLGQVIGGVVQHGCRRTVLLYPTQDIHTRDSTGIQSLAKSVEHGRPDLDRISAAQLLNREANLIRACQPVNCVNRGDRDLRCDVQAQLSRTAVVF